MPARALALLTLALLFPSSAPAQAPKDSARSQRVAMPRPVQVKNGRVQGYFTADQQVISYKGIPYAQPPIDELRWKPPVPMGKWKGLLQARDFGPHCLQSTSYPDMVFHDPAPSEDCLTLNIWLPASATNARPARNASNPGGLPVMVWIYGGGFMSGGTSEDRQNGEFLARRGVIVVSMNYRLGIFGFFALPELTSESSNHSSGNYGLMDQTAALSWVRMNIAAFGGDPNNVTLFGQSAGSMSVSAQMASPAAVGLFEKAIGQSGSEFPSPGRNLPTLTDAAQADDAWASRTFGSDRLFYLRQLPADEILTAATSRTHTVPRFGPIVDGAFLPDTVAHIFADGKQAHIPLLAGWVADEQHTTHLPTSEEFTAQFQSDFGPDAQQALTFYPASDVARSANNYAGDRFLAYSTWAWIEAHSRTGRAPVYRYFFDLPSPGDRNHPASLGAFHSDDIEYVFGTLDSRPGITLRPEDRALSTLMQQYWVNFARTGDPNGPGLPQWPAYNTAGSSNAAGTSSTAGVSDAYPVMRLDATPAAAPDSLRPRYLFLDRYWSAAAPAR